MRLVILLFFIIGLAACAKKPAPPPSELQNATVALAETADSVNHSVIALNTTEQAANPPVSIATPPNPDTYGMGIPASLSWEGPAEQAVAAIAKASNYRFRVLGAKPSLPVLVSVHENNSTLGDILRNIGLQCRKQAQVVVYPKIKTIELRYTESS